MSTLSTAVTYQAPQPWANSLPYNQLFAQASDQQRTITLKFHSPTGFRQGDYDSALPVARTVFSTPYRRWQEYSGIPLAPDLLDHLEKNLCPTSFDLKTEHYRDPWGSFLGCTGTITYCLRNEQSLEFIKQINALADYLYFSGSGRKTAMGKGQVTRLACPDSPRRG